MKKTQISARLDTDLCERARRAAYWIGKGLTFTTILEAGLKQIVEQLEKDHHKGRPFPPSEDTPL